MRARNPYREALAEHPRTWRTRLASFLLRGAIRLDNGFVGLLAMSTAWSKGWRKTALGPEPLGDEDEPRWIREIVPTAIHEAQQLLNAPFDPTLTARERNFARAVLRLARANRPAGA